MKYREGQIEYYGKKGMSLLGAMFVQCVRNYDGYTGVKYSFVDYVIKGYSAQDNTQVSSIIQLLLKFVKRKLTNVKEICLQSDNASCFISQNIIPYIYHLQHNESVKIVKWIVTEAQTGK